MARAWPRFILLALALAHMGGTYAFAAGEAPGLCVHPVFSGRQEGTHASYYEIQTLPAEQIALQAVLANGSDRAITVALAAHTAYTGDSGSIQYTGGGDARVSPPVLFSDIVTFGARQIDIAPGESVLVTADIAMPRTPYDGMLLGSLAFTEIAPPGEASRGQSLVQYVIGVVLRQGDGQAPARLLLDSVRIEASTDGKTTLTARLQSWTADMLRPLSIKMTVLNARAEPVGTAAFQDWSAAPYALLCPRMQLPPALPPGPYTLEIQAGLPGQLFSFSYPFMLPN